MGGIGKTLGTIGAVAGAIPTGGASLSLLPAIIGAGATIGTSLLGRKMAGPNVNPTPGEQAATTGMGSAAGSLTNTGTQLAGMGVPAIQSGLGYYQRLLGRREAQQGAVAPAASNITQAFKGAS